MSVLPAKQGTRRDAAWQLEQERDALREQVAALQAEREEWQKRAHQLYRRRPHPIRLQPWPLSDLGTPRPSEAEATRQPHHHRSLPSTAGEISPKIVMQGHRSQLLDQAQPVTASHAKVYVGPQLLSSGGDLVPVTLSFTDPKLGPVDMLVYVESSTLRFRNNGQTLALHPCGGKS